MATKPHRKRSKNPKSETAEQPSILEHCDPHEKSGPDTHHSQYENKQPDESWKDYIKRGWKGISFLSRVEIGLGIAIALFTGGMFILSGYQVYLMRTNAKWELRAYVDIQNVRIQKPVPGHPIKVTWEIRNSGQTPALNVQMPQVAGFLTEFPISAISAIYRGHKFGGLQDGFPIQPHITVPDSTLEMPEFSIPDSMGNRTIYFAGVVFYRDVFGYNTTQEFVFRYSWDFDRTVRMTREEYGTPEDHP